MRSISELIYDSFSVFKKDFLRCIYILLPVILFSSVSSLLSDWIGELDLWIRLCIPFIGYFIFATSMAALAHAVHDSTLTVLGSFKKVGFSIISYIGLLVLLIFIGILALAPLNLLSVSFVLLPLALPLLFVGIFLLVSFSFAPFFLLLEQESITKSLASSFKLTKGKLSPVFLRVLAFVGVVVFITTLLRYVSYLTPIEISEIVYNVYGIAVMFFVCAFYTISMFELYTDLKKMQSAPVETEVV